MTDAARRALLVREGLAAVAEWEAEHGAFSATEIGAKARIRRAQGTRQPNYRSHTLSSMNGRIIL